MARHDQRPTKFTFVCDECKFGNCGGCMDVLRSIYTDEGLCACKRPDHAGEALQNQVKDPFTGSVHGPGAEITVEGEVKVNEQFRQRFIEQHQK